MCSFSKGRTVEQVATHELLWTFFALPHAGQPGQLGEHLLSRCPSIAQPFLDSGTKGMVSIKAASYVIPEMFYFTY